MKVAVEGCCHGELDKIYETLDCLERKNNIQIDLLLICGDFQAVRNKSDLQCMAVPQKYQRMNTFYKYYSGEKKAPYLTIFIGGNHEASNYMQELPYGGWVAPNIYYMGYAGVVQVAGIRIGGLSGIYKGRDLHKGHFEHPPYNNDTVRSAYHVRELEIFRLKQLSRHLDIFMSHDWPRGIYNYGNVNALLKVKHFLKEEIEADKLGSPPAAELLYKLQPDYWFSAHLHVKFPAIVEHKTSGSESKTTKFLSLDKCLPRRKFLQVLDIPHDPEKPKEIHLDPEWLAILKSTNHLLSLSRCPSFMPGPGGTDRWDFTVSKEDMNSILEDFGGDLSLPENFEKTVPVFDPSASTKKQPIAPPQTCTNPQTTLLCTMLELTDPNAVFLGKDNSCKIDVGEEDVEKAEGFDSDDDADEDDTEYESEPSFIMSGSEQSFSFLSTSNADESFSSLGNPDEINIDDDDIQNISAASETSVSDEDAEFKAIMEAQKKEQLSENDENKSASTSKSSLSQSDIDDDDSELQDILAAQRKTQASSSLTGHVELALTGSEDEEPQDIVSEQKKLKESDILRPVSHSSPASSDERSDSEVVKGTLSLALSSEKYNQKRTDGGSESEDSPQSKRFKRRNQQLYESADENTS